MMEQTQSDTTPYELTILEAVAPRYSDPKPRLAKTIHWQSIQSYDAAYLYNARTVEAHSVAELADVLRDLTAQPHACVVRGGLREGVRPNRIERRCHGDGAPLVEVARNWAAFDLDELYPPEGLLDDPDAVAAWLWGQLPSPLAGCAGVVQWTAGAFVDLFHGRPVAGQTLTVKSKGGARCRLWFVLSAPVESGAWRAWARETRKSGGLRVDPCLFSPVQPHYTAAPEFVGRAPVLLDDERVVVMPGLPVVDVAGLLAGHSARVVVQAREREAREVQAAQRRASSEDDAHDWACAALALERLDPDLAYDEWLSVGMAIHSRWPTGEGLGLWEQWSRGGGKYQDGDCEHRWDGFRGGGVNLGTLFSLAKSAGWTMPAREVVGAREARLDVGGVVELGEVPERVRATVGRVRGEQKASAEGLEGAPAWEEGMGAPPLDLWGGHPADGDGGAALTGEREWLPPPPLTGLGNAERLLVRQGRNLLYAHDAGKWFVWREGWWAKDERGLAQQKAIDAARGLLFQKERYLRGEDGAPLEGEARDRAERKFRAHWAKGESAAGVKEALLLASSSPTVACLTTDFDLDPWLLGAGGKVVDLRTGETCDGKREQRISKQAACAPARAVPGQSPCPTWERFVLDVMGGSQELADYLQRVVGYALTGHNREQKLWFFEGFGSNGKTTFLETLAKAMGDYATTARFESFLAKDSTGINNDIAALQGRRFVYTEEPKQGARFDTASIKELTGGGKVKARLLFKEFFEFDPQFTLFFAANFKPSVNDVSDGFWRRIVVVPWRKQWRTSEDHPKEWPEADRTMPARLWAERAGILAWAVEGARLWAKEGLQEPACLQQEMKEWRRNEDILGAFLDECCVQAKGVTCYSKQLYDAYRPWAIDRGLEPVSMIRLSKDLRLRLMGKVTTDDDEKGKRWSGLGLLDRARAYQEAPRAQGGTHPQEVPSW